RHFAERLAGFGGETEIPSREIIHALHSKLLDEGWQALRNLNDDRHFVVLPAKIPLAPGRDADVAEAIGAIQALEGVHVAVEQALREASAAELEAARLDSQ